VYVHSNAPTLRTVTLGCKVNQYETQFVREGLSRLGYRDAAVGETADLCVVNTCTVTAEGDAKSRQTIRQLAARNPGTRIVVMGCYATRAPDEVAELPGVVEVVTDKREIPDLLGRFGLVDVPNGISHFNGRKRAYVKVQDGCLLRCSFCIIPLVRPVMTSRPPEHITDEVRRLVDYGHREIILTGIHLGHYGVDLNLRRHKSDWVRLAHLVERIARLPGDFRLRLSSIEATEVTRELVAVMAANQGRVCPHLHVSMQSGSEGVLRRMRRRWGVRRFVDRCELVKRSLEQPALTTDVIVGFPGESERDFDDTRRVCEELGFSKIHVFRFSPRRGTPAADMTGQVPEPIKIRRAAEMAQLERRLADRYHRSLLGRELQVMIESPLPDRPGRAFGTSCRYAPVELPADAGALGTFAYVRAVGVSEGRIIGELAGSSRKYPVRRSVGPGS
jgi:threonylcarbamoyladenosine tRNA methylthiotransferase MtaB